MRQFIAALLILSSSAAMADCEEDALQKVPGAFKPKVTSTMQTSALATHMATITSPAQLTCYMKMTPPQENLLSVLSGAARKRFLESLTFNEKGLTGYRYA